MKRRESEEENMTAQEFYRAFKNSLSDDFMDEYKSGRRWTGTITRIMGQIICNAGYQFEKEFYRIDYIGWMEKKNQDEIENEAKNLEMIPCLWDLKIAIEHENDQADWTYELVKLVHISCPLKVVIGYSPCDQRKVGQLEEKRLEYAARLMSKVEAFKSTSCDEYLIILGNARAKNNNSTYNTFGYRGYVYKDGQFCQIKL